MHGEFTTLSVTPTYERRKKWEPINPKNIISAIPGTIVEIFVKNGSVVKAGDELLVFKAMKMNNTICAETDGVIKNVIVEVGSRITKGSIMIEFE